MKLPFKSSGADDTTAPQEGEMSLLGHLSELRTRLIRSVIAIVVGTIIVYIFNKRIFGFLEKPYCDQQEALGNECEFIIRSPTESFSVVLAISGYGGLLLALPVVLYQLGKFVMPGLYPSERKVLFPFFGASIVLLFLGLASGYLLMPKTLSVLTSFGSDNFVDFFSPREYIGLFVKMLLAFGLAAELPLILIFLQLVGIVSTATLRKNRRIAVVAVVILAAIVTPTGDPFTLGVLAIPMYLFYELAVIVGGRMTKHRLAVNT
ncbi:MAG: twin-arginine translocase subunit TatC [Actinomycetia bacterium]|nr:twin-arginine translocase subunit TatC [Actinomycetes bacterium]MCP4224806.1 twin-arginine translocase subunit TatC [Actinomycetes bacterium]MCP5033457.1 twin-arginine translocase subunit TatC [Actinomycetes bacterium]